MLSLHHLTVQRESRVVLRDASLDLGPNDLVCVIGEEGSGKTTLLRTILRDLPVQEGVINIDTAILAQLPRDVLRMYRTRIGYLDEAATLDPTLTIEQNVALPLDLHGIPAAERNRAVSDLLKRLRLSTVAHHTPSRVSRGERQLTAIARTIAAGPMILLLDEPFHGLSQTAAGVVAQLLQNMCKRGATIVIASADERTAGLFTSPRIVRLARGKLTEETARAPAPSPSPATRARTIAQTTASTLADRAAAASAPAAPTPEPSEEDATEGRKIRITAVGSL